MPTAPLPAGLSLLNLPFDGGVAGSPVGAVVAAGDEQPGAADGFPAILSDQINNAKKAGQFIDNKKHIDSDELTLMLQLGPGTVYPISPGWQSPGEPVDVAGAGVPGIPLTQTQPGLPALPAGESSGSVLPEGRQSGAGGFPPSGADWPGRQLAALGRERLTDPVVTRPRGQVPTPGQSALAGQAGSVALPAGTVAPATGPGAALALEPLLAQGTQSAAGSLPGQPAATPPAADDAKPPLPALPEQAARALPAAAYFRQEQPLPLPDPRASAASDRSGTIPGQTIPAMTAARGAVVHSPLVMQRQPAASAGQGPASAIVSSASVHAGDREVPGSSLPSQTGASAPVPAPRAASLPVVPAASLAAYATEPVREATPGGSWFAAQLGVVPQGAAQSSRPAPPQPGTTPGPAMADAAQSGSGAAVASPSPLPVSGATSAEAGAAFSSHESGLERETASAAALPDSASRSSSQPAAGPSMVALVQPRSESVLAPAFGQPLQLAAAGFADDLGQRILWLSGSNLRSAEIHIDPPELGPLQITVQAHREGTTIHFTTHNAQAREAVEATLPRLRELLEGNGAGTVDVNVAQQQPDARPGEREAPAMASAAARAVRVETGTLDPLPRLLQGLIDDYA